MNESGVKECPKCGGEMKKGKIYGGFFTRIIAFERPASSFWRVKTDLVKAFGCENWGYIELYRELKESRLS